MGVKKSNTKEEEGEENGRASVELLVKHPKMSTRQPRFHLHHNHNRYDPIVIIFITLLTHPTFDKEH